MSTSFASPKETGNASVLTNGVVHRRHEKLLRVSLACGVVAPLLYIAMNIYVPMKYPGYSVVSQTVSELSAIGAPTRPLWVGLALLYSLLITAFGWGVWQSAGGNRTLRIAGILMLIQAVAGFFWPPMHLREALAAGQGSLTDTMHIAFAMVTLVLMMLMIGFGAASFGKRFRFFSISCMAVFVVFGILTGIDGPRISQNLPTPFIGIWERINIGVFMVWLMVLAVILLQKENKPLSTHDA